MTYDSFKDYIISHIGEIAQFYVPEWKFDPQTPDAGSALALVFARQLAQSMEKFSKMPLKHKIALYSLLGGDILPASAGDGFVCIKPSAHCVDGFVVKNGFKFYADVNGSRLPFEAASDVFVTPAVLTEMLFSDYKNDIISVWAGGDNPFTPGGKRTERIVEFEHDYFKSGLPVYLNAVGLNDLLCDRQFAVPFYINGQGDKIETECERSEKGIVFSGLSSRDELPYGVGFDIKDVDAFEGVAFDEITVFAEAENIAPAAVVINGEQQSGTEFYPFGKELVIHDDIAFFCPALAIPKADITLSFDVRFDMFEVGEIIRQPLPQRKFIVRKKDIPKPKIYDIILTGVEWEYFNGLGFAPLHLKYPAKQIFGQNLGGTYHLQFTRPDDMAATLIGPMEGYCIRARIIDVKNAWQRPARIIAPRMSNVKFSCTAPPSSVKVGRIHTNGEIHALADFRGRSLRRPLPESAAVYFGFDRPLCGGEVKLFVKCRGGGNAGWQCLTDKGWKDLMVNDMTEGLTHDGTVSFNAEEDTVESKLYGKSAHWLRVVFKERTIPTVEKLYLNAVPVSQCDRCLNETYFVDRNGTAKLKHSDIFEEKIYIGENFEKQLTKDLDYRIDRADGIIEFASELKCSDGFSFKIDCSFGGGKHTNLPPFTVFTPASSAANISQITNPLPFTGGQPRESREQAEVRIGKSIRNGGRCITSADYMDLIDDPEITYAKCFSKNGKITLVILIKDYKNEYAFHKIRRRALTTLNSLRPVGSPEIEIIPPVIVSVAIRAELLVQKESSSKILEETLNDLCNPLVRMKELGLNSVPDAEEICRALSVVPGVKECRSLLVINDKDANIYALPTAGTFDIKFYTYTGENTL